MSASPTAALIKPAASVGEENEFDFFHSFDPVMVLLAPRPYSKNSRPEPALSITCERKSTSEGRVISLSLRCVARLTGVEIKWVFLVQFWTRVLLGAAIYPLYAYLTLGSFTLGDSLGR